MAMTGLNAALLMASLCLAAFAGLLAWAAYGDVRRYLIPNKISLLILATYVGFSLSSAFLPDFYPSVNWFGGFIVGGVMLAVGLVLFARGIMGGGDVKLLASASVWAGPAHIFDLLVITALVGGVLAVAVGLSRVRHAQTEPADSGPVKEVALPYGVAIAVGGVVVATQLGSALWSATV